MDVQRKLFRLAAWTAVAGMVLGPAVPPVHAQALPPGADQAGGPEITPPLRVGRLAWTQGTVSFHTADQDSWSPAVVNYPVTQGAAFWTQPGAEAGLQVSDVLVALGPTTELDIDTLDETNFAATEPQGEVYLRVRSLTPGETYSLQTPRGTVTIATPGRYEITAGTTGTPTLVTVLEGAAQVSGAQPLDVPPGQTAVITGDQEFQTELAPAMRDDFLNSMLAREQQRPTVATAVPPIVAQMPGGDELAQYGSWSQTPEYGQVWYPQVQAGWQPYREGHWAYVAPWGWTWIDDDPWGFAPFHYGRWAEIGGRWGWIPGTEVVAEAPPQPVYAPALVAFFGVGLGLAAGAAFGGSVGWCPLGPGEVWHPWFRANQRYVRDVNIRHVTNITSITNTTVNNVTINNFRNARAATVVPAATMMTSQRVRPVARSIAPQELARVHPVVGRQPLPPTTATLGVTPAVARQMHIAAPPPGVAVPRRAEAPGPAIRGPVAVTQPGQHPAAPHLRAPEQTATTGVAATPHAPAAVQAGPPSAAHPAINEPRATAHAPPSLRPPGAGQAGPPPVQHEPGRTAGLAMPHAGTTAPEQPHVANTPSPHLAAPTPPSVHTPNEPAHPTAHAAPALRPTEPAQRAAVPPPIEAPHAATVPHPTAVPHPAPEMHAYAPPTAVHQPPAPVPHPVAPQAAIHPAAPPPVMHQAAPPPVTHPVAPQAAIHPAAPPPVMHQAPPVVHQAPPPAPRPVPEMHAAAPPPHIAAPAPAPAAQQHHQKRPGEP